LGDKTLSMGVLRKEPPMQENVVRNQPAAEVKSLKSLLQYQEGAIVSRILLKNPAGTVTLFAFGKGEGLSEHTAPFDALVICVEGEADLAISGKSYRLHEGESITMPANEPHAVQAASDFKMLLVMIKA
jgi:quercetin dioxygenase-like cupin family protein